MEKASGCVLDIRPEGSNLFPIGCNTVAAIGGRTVEVSTRQGYDRETDLHAVYHILEMFLPPVHNQQLSTKFDVDLHPLDRQHSYPLQPTDICETPPPRGREFNVTSTPTTRCSNSPLQLRIHQLPPGSTLTSIEWHLSQVAPSCLSPIPIRRTLRPHKVPTHAHGV